MSSKSFQLSNLPFEIASRISKNLDTSSLANCCLVNKHWYACFVSNVWESPKVNGLAHLKSIHHSLESIHSILSDDEDSNENSSTFVESYNDLKIVKNLDLNILVDEYDINENADSAKTFDYADIQTHSFLSDFSSYCYNLKYLSLKVPSEKNSSKDAPNFFATLKQFAEKALSLESITLDFNDMTVFADHLQDFPIECFTKLHTLNLKNATMVDDSAFIWFWSNCPSLASISISQSSNLNDYILNILIRLHSDTIKEINLEKCSRLSINSLLNIIVSCKNLEKLSWVNNGACFQSTLLSNSSSNFEIKDMKQFMAALEENSVIDHLKELNYSFLKISNASVIFDFIIEKNRENLVVIKCDNSNALINAAQKNIVFPHLKEISCNNKSVCFKELSKSALIHNESCKAPNPVEENNAVLV